MDRALLSRFLCILRLRKLTTDQYLLFPPRLPMVQHTKPESPGRPAADRLGKEA
jgi:hypothetical protein